MIDLTAWRKMAGGVWASVLLRLSQRRVRGVTAGAFSLILHGLALWLLLMTPQMRLKGLGQGDLQGVMAPSPGQTPVGVTLVLPKPETSRDMPAPAPAAEVKAPPAETVAEATIPVADSPAAEDEAADTPVAAAFEATALSEPVTPADGTAEANPALAASQGGTPDGNTTLLEQIARCLPPGVRPALDQALLNVSLDAHGQLSAVPVLQVDVSLLSEEELRDANLVVQATLQCGPYVLPEQKAESFVVVPDFSIAMPAAPAQGQADDTQASL